MEHHVCAVMPASISKWCVIFSIAELHVYPYMFYNIDRHCCAHRNFWYTCYVSSLPFDHTICMPETTYRNNNILVSFIDSALELMSSLTMMTFDLCYMVCSLSLSHLFHISMSLSPSLTSSLTSSHSSLDIDHNHRKDTSSAHRLKRGPVTINYNKSLGLSKWSKLNNWN